MVTPTASALKVIEGNLPRYRKDLETLVRIPSVSAAGFQRAPLARAARSVAALARRAGMLEVQVLTLTDGPPAVFGRLAGPPGAPSVLLYGHYDVQPAGSVENWRSAPFEPEVRRGRLYGRGAVDDKAGVVALLAAIEAWHGAGGRAPVEIKLLVEGEEEVGSPHLPALLEREAARLRADALIVLDTPSFATGVPALTYRLRGVVTLDVEVRCLKRPLHSGRGAGVVPDAISALCSLIAGLYREDGSLDMPAFDRLAEKPGASERAFLRALPFDLRRTRRDAGVLGATRLLGAANEKYFEKLWTEPALSVIAIEAVPLAEAANQLVDSARARLSLRTVPGIRGVDAYRILRRRLQKDPPHGARVTVRSRGAVEPWRTDTDGAAFEAALRCLRTEYRCEPRRIGAGGSIGFLQAFARLLPHCPCLLLGLEDPPCRAHSIDESVHLGDWRRAMRALVRLLGELPKLHPAPLA